MSRESSICKVFNFIKPFTVFENYREGFGSSDSKFKTQ